MTMEKSNPAPKSQVEPPHGTVPDQKAPMDLNLREIATHPHPKENLHHGDELVIPPDPPTYDEALGQAQTRSNSRPMQHFGLAITLEQTLRYNKLERVLGPALQAILTEDREKDAMPLSMRLVVLGHSVDDAHPCIVVTCDKKVLAKIVPFFDQDWVQDELDSNPKGQAPAFELYIKTIPCRPQAAWDINIGEWIDDKNFLEVVTNGSPVHAKARTGSYRATLGGFIEVVRAPGQVELYGLTVDHLLWPWNETNNSSGNIPMFTLRGSRSTKQRGPELQRDATEIPFGVDDAYKIDNSFDVELELARGTIERKSRHGHVCTHVHDFGIPNYKFFGYGFEVSADQLGSRGLDYALISMQYEWRCFNSRQFHRLPAHASERPNEKAYKRKVHLLNAVGTATTGFLLSDMTSFMLSPTTGFVKTYLLELDEGNKFSDGDSGSWVVDAESDVVYGYLVAVDLFGDGFVIPLNSALDDIKSNLGAQDVRLANFGQSSLAQCQAVPQADAEIEAPGQTPKPSMLNRPIRSFNAFSGIVPVSAGDPLEHTSNFSVYFKSKQDLANVEQSSYGYALRAASSRDYTELVLSLLKQGVNLNDPNASSHADHIKTLKHLLDGAIFKDDMHDRKGRDIFWWASAGGHVEVVRLFLERGKANINKRDDERKDSFWIAAHNGHAEMVNFLSSVKGIEMNAIDHEGRNPLWAAASNGHVEVVRLLLEMSQTTVDLPDNQGQTPLDVAVYRNRGEVVSVLVESGQADFTSARNGSIGCNTPLGIAAHFAHAEIAEILLSKETEAKAQASRYGQALVRFSGTGHIEIARQLLRLGADVNAQGGLRDTALGAASQNGHDDVVHMLLDHGADIDAQGGFLGNCLQMALNGRYIETALILLDRGADVHAQIGHDGNALQTAAKMGDDGIEVVRKIIDKGADVNAQGGFECNALVAAASRGDGGFQVMKILLDSGADVNASDGRASSGRCVNALEAAARAGTRGIRAVNLLLDRGAVVNGRGGSGGSALQAASDTGCLEMVQLLLAQGADVNAQGGNYGTPLQVATVEGHVEVVKLLLAHGADANAKDSKHTSAMERAVTYRLHQPLTQMLLDSLSPEQRETWLERCPELGKKRVAEDGEGVRTSVPIEGLGDGQEADGNLFGVMPAPGNPGAEDRQMADWQMVDAFQIP